MSVQTARVPNIFAKLPLYLFLLVFLLLSWTGGVVEISELDLSGHGPVIVPKSFFIKGQDQDVRKSQRVLSLASKSK